MTEYPNWQIPDEELMKSSPAAVAVRKMLSGEASTMEEMVSQMQGMGVEVDVHNEVDPGPDPAFPERPDHPDFWALSRIVQQMDHDAETNNQGDVVGSLCPFGVDARSVVYMAKQRVLRGEKLLSEEGTFYAKAVIMWLDAFTAGVQLGREQAVKTVLDGSIERGSHRAGGVR
jgi:hypothetical protein